MYSPIDSEEYNNLQISATVILLEILLPYTLPQIPYNNLELPSASYAPTILNGNPQRCVDVLQNEPVSKLLSMEEKLTISLYINGHNNSNKQAQDRFQHSSQTI
ncbi:uncharacterized protein VP01_887g8 [Puccinia sorghi]|uniref:DUF8040 domain-containing protein n=1 Tax=Puccinia sorghi TaxID=27349 RepID=A0A0L6U868_9BASI|nr:uncharacterized protein VP01_887g8 [Puccinia sorghi]